jgi:glycosyltransferase involved in cell wall biosynthesis
MTPVEKPISVAFFAHSSQLGGAERSLLELIHELITDYGVICTLIVPSAGPLSEAVARLGASIICCELPSWAFANEQQSSSDLARRHLAGGSRNICRNLLPELRRIDPDVIFTQTLVIPWGALAAGVLGKPHIWHVCEFAVPEHGVWFSEPREEILAAIDSGSSVLLTAVDGIRNALFPRVTPDRIRTIYRHIPVPEHVAPDTKAYRHAGAARLGVFATLTAGKGQEDAVRAVAELLRRGRDVELLLAGVVGEPEYHQSLLGLIEELGLGDRVRLSGHLSEPYSAMAATDIVLVCSRQEAFARVAVEAMLLGRPVVYAGTGGVLEYLEDGETGLSYRPGIVEELVSRIELLIDEPARAQRIGCAAQKRARKKFNRDAYGGEVFRILKGLRTDPPCRVQVPPQLLSAMADVLADPEKTIPELRVAALERAITALRTSTSWRITAPLRGAKLFARRLRQAARRSAAPMQLFAPRRQSVVCKAIPDRAPASTTLFGKSSEHTGALNSEQNSPDRAISMSNYSRRENSRYTGKVYSVRFLYDAPGWAYYNNGRDLAKHAPPDFKVSLARFLSPSDLSSALGNEAPDLLILNRLSEIACVRKELDKRKWPTKLIGFWSTGWPRRIEQLADVLKHADLINFVNHAYWRNLGMPTHSVCIPLGVDLEVFRPLVPFEDRPRRILWIGSELNSAVKGYEAIVVHLREILCRAGFECDFRLVNSFDPNLLSQKEMAEWYNTGRAFLVTSTVEGTPNVALEAAACGCALISTRVGNMPELIRNSENGVLVEDPHHQLFYDAIVGSEPRWQEMAQAVLADIGEWSWERRARQIFSALRSLIDSPVPACEASADERSDPGSSPSGQLRSHALTNKPDLSDKVSVFVTTVGSRSFELCLQFLEHQDCSFRSKVIANVAPMSAAFQRMLDDCETEFFVQVDEDMLLYPHAVRTLFERISRHPANIALHVEYLYDTHLQKCIQGVKIFRTKIAKRYPFRDVQGCETDQISRFRGDGFDYVVSAPPDPDDPYGNTFGLHGTNFSRETAYLRYFVLQQRHRCKPWEWRMLTVELAERFRNEPSELNFFSLGGALAGLSVPVTDAEKDFRVYSRTPGFQELAEFYDAIAGRKPSA